MTAADVGRTALAQWVTVDDPPAACEACGDTGGVYAWQNGRSGWHPCPRGCQSRPACECQS